MHIILLPGMDATGILYDEFIAALGNNFPCTVLNYPTGKFLNYSQLETLVRVQLPKSEPFILLAESFSGPIGIAIAANAPENLQGLILCCTFARNPMHKLLSFSFLIDLLPVKLIPLQLMSYMMMGKFRDERLGFLFAEALNRIPTRILKQRMKAALTINTLNIIDKIKVPTLYLQAKYDLLVSKKSAFEIKAALPSMHLVELKAPHFLLQTKPLDAAQTIHAYFSPTQTA